MFTPAMTNKEIQHEAFLDFLEMKGKIQIAFGEFLKNQNTTNGKQYLIHSIVQIKTIRTRQHNSWNIRFFDCYHKPGGEMIGGFLAYTPLHRGEETDCLFLRDKAEFSLEMVSAHFMQRYKERYLEPNNINTAGMPPAIYFQRYTQDMKPTCFFPENWSAKEQEERMVWISNQGLFVTQEEDEMRIFITFLDQENLTRYKAIIYEEEALMRLYNKGNEIKDPILQTEIFSRMFNTPNARVIHERYVRRTTNYKLPNPEELIQKSLAAWDNLEMCTAKIKKIMDTVGIDACRKQLNLPEKKIPEHFKDF